VFAGVLYDTKSYRCAAVWSSMEPLLTFIVGNPPYVGLRPTGIMPCYALSRGCFAWKLVSIILLISNRRQGTTYAAVLKATRGNINLKGRDSRVSKVELRSKRIHMLRKPLLAGVLSCLCRASFGGNIG
jgi:hypothetical protein